MSHTARLTGTEWQDWAVQILCCHYGPTEFQRIHDRDQGDAGLEGFTRTEGHAFQAYGCEEPLSTNQRYERQRDKMTEDIGKFISNRAKLVRLLGQVKITRWVLFVPYCNTRRLVSHATTKTEEVIAAGLPYVAPTFHVCVCQEDDYPEERDRLINAAVKTLQIEATTPTQQQIDDWTQANQQPSATLTDKLQRLNTLRTVKQRAKFHAVVLDWYLRGQEVLEALRKHPPVYTKVQKVKAHHEAFLAATFASGMASNELLNSTLNQLKVSLETQVRELHKFPSDILAHEAVADWLLRCPLDFPGEEEDG